MRVSSYLIFLTIVPLVVKTVTQAPHQCCSNVADFCFSTLPCSWAVFQGNTWCDTYSNSFGATLFNVQQSSNIIVTSPLCHTSNAMCLTFEYRIDFKSSQTFSLIISRFTVHNQLSEDLWHISSSNDVSGFASVPLARVQLDFQIQIHTKRYGWGEPMNITLSNITFHTVYCPLLPQSTTPPHTTRTDAVDSFQISTTQEKVPLHTTESQTVRSDNQTAIIGAGVSVILVVIIAVVVGVILFKRKQLQFPCFKANPRQNQSDNSDGISMRELGSVVSPSHMSTTPNAGESSVPLYAVVKKPKRPAVNGNNQESSQNPTSNASVCQNIESPHHPSRDRDSSEPNSNAAGTDQAYGTRSDLGKPTECTEEYNTNEQGQTYFILDKEPGDDFEENNYGNGLNTSALKTDDDDAAIYHCIGEEGDAENAKTPGTNDNRTKLQGRSVYHFAKGFGETQNGGRATQVNHPVNSAATPQPNEDEASSIYHVIGEDEDRGLADDGTTDAASYYNVTQTSSASPVSHPDNYNVLNFHGEKSTGSDSMYEDTTTQVYSHLNDGGEQDGVYNQVDRERKTDVIDDEYSHIQ